MFAHLSQITEQRSVVAVHAGVAAILVARPNNTKSHKQPQQRHHEMTETTARVE
jgi:hypothetical protein